MHDSKAYEINPAKLLYINNGLKKLSYKQALNS